MMQQGMSEKLTIYRP